MVFYIPFINVFAGIRGVDQRLVNMARIVGASETKISREVIWNSLLPFFFTALKIALPRAVSACIVGEFLVSTEGVGHYIEHARELSDTVGVFAGIVVATTLVLAVNGSSSTSSAARSPGARSTATWCFERRRYRASFDCALRAPLGVEDGCTTPLILSGAKRGRRTHGGFVPNPTSPAPCEWG